MPLRFPGQYADPETGLHYNNQRYYDPITGSYLSPDPLGLMPALNPHTYVPNPHILTDPLGLDPGGNIASPEPPKTVPIEVTVSPGAHIAGNVKVPLPEGVDADPGTGKVTADWRGRISRRSLLHEEILKENTDAVGLVTNPADEIAALTGHLGYIHTIDPLGNGLLGGFVLIEATIWRIRRIVFWFRR